MCGVLGHLLELHLRAGGLCIAPDVQAHVLGIAGNDFV